MKSLKATLILRLLVGGILLLGLAGAAFQWRMSRALTAEFDSSLRLSAQSLQAFIEQKKHVLRMDSEVDDMPQFDSPRDPAVFLLCTADGREIKRSPSLGGATLPTTGGPVEKPAFFETDLADGRKLRCIGIFLIPRNEDDDNRSDRGTSVLLVVGLPRGSLAHTLSELVNAQLIAGVLALAGLSALLLWGVRRGLRPLDRLVADISGVSADSLDTRLAEDSLPAELKPIASRLNELLARLAAVFEREKNFTANVSHELRTPLAELRALAEVNLMVPPATTAENAACWTEVKTVSGRMESLALRLLELARAGQVTPVAGSSVDLAPLVEAIWSRHSADAAESGITCARVIPAALAWHTDPVLLDVILSNLVSNAVHHAVPGSVLRVVAEGATMRFTNAAEGLTDADLPGLFERFWKKDASRSDGRRHGLGLALARETAVLLGGSLEARLTGDSVEFELRGLDHPAPESQ